MKSIVKFLATMLLTIATASLSGCSDPHVYGSIGVSSGFGGYHGGYGPRVRTSISVGGRIR
jgi:hypothetical protein